MNLHNIFARSIGPIVVLLLATCESSTAQQPYSDNETYYVANTRPPDAFLVLRTNPTTSSGQRILAMPNGTPLQVLERRGDGWWYVRVLPSGPEGWALSRQGSSVWIQCCGAAPSEPPAGAPIGFKTPSGNIYCLLEDTDLRCDLGK
jgi:hypothetical protein